VEDLNEKCSAKECHLKNLKSRVEWLTVEHQKRQQEMNAKVVSASLLLADINRLTGELSVCSTSVFFLF